MNNKNQMFNKGFTLLELLVVIGIIGILISLITVSFTSAQKSGRDSRRRQDLTSIQNAMEQYYAQNNFTYPACACTDNPASGNGCCAALNGYFSSGKAPMDPLTTNTQYQYAGNASSYTVTAVMEKGASISVSNLQ